MNPFIWVAFKTEIGEKYEFDELGRMRYFLNFIFFKDIRNSNYIAEPVSLKLKSENFSR